MISAPDQVLGRVLLGVAVVVVVTQLVAPVLSRLGQPAVLAQVLAGILLGPVFLGALPGSPTQWLFPDVVRSALSAIGGLGLVLFLFLIGLEIDVPAARAGGRRLAAITAGSIVLPFALGVLAAVTVLAGRAPGGVSGVAFAVFLGTALSVSALPVLARLMDERGLTHTPVGQLTLASASLQDVATWLLLALTLALASHGTDGVLRALAGASGVVVALVFVIRPLLLRVRLADSEASSGATVGLIAAGLLGCAAAAQLTGLHAAVGALAFGVAFRRAALPALRDGLERAIGPLVRGVLLPVYFLVPGLSFTLHGLGGSSLPTILVLLACAAGGKLVGAGVPALLTGVPRRTAAAIAVLLNTRGLVELIVLNVALENRVIDAGLYSELATVALLTTFATGPLLNRVLSTGPPRDRDVNRPHGSGDDRHLE